MTRPPALERTAHLVIGSPQTLRTLVHQVRTDPACPCSCTFDTTLTPVATWPHPTSLLTTTHGPTCTHYPAGAVTIAAVLTQPGQRGDQEQADSGRWDGGAP